MLLKEEYSKEEILNYIDEIKQKFDEFRHAVYALSSAVGEVDKDKERYLDIDLRDMQEQYDYMFSDIEDIIAMYEDVDIDIEEEEEDED